jgi:hypothetical protein
VEAPRRGRVDGDALPAYVKNGRLT